MPISIREYLAIGKLIALLGAIALICWQSSQIHRWHTHSIQCADARHADRLSYAEAQREAQATNKANVAKIEQQYQRNRDNEHQSYLSDRAKLIAYFDGLRAQRKAAPGSANPTAPSAPNTAPGGADGNGLQVPPADDLQTRQDAAEIELRLMHLQEYVAGLLAIDPNAH